MKSHLGLVCFLILSSTLCVQGIPSLTTAEWTQDLGYFANEIATHHRDPYHMVPKARFDAEVAELRGRIPSMKSYEIVVGLQRLAASIGDGHTFVDTGMLYGAVPAVVPIEVFRFGDELRVVRAAPEYSRALGTRIVAVGSKPISEARRSLQQLIPQGESEWFVMVCDGQERTQIEPLAALQIISYGDTASFTFETDAGPRFTLPRFAPTCRA